MAYDSESPREHDQMFSLVTQQGSLADRATEEWSKSDPNAKFDESLEEDTLTEKVLRCLEQRQSKTSSRNEIKSDATYESLANELFFGHLSLEEKYFTGQGNKGEISSAADLVDMLEGSDIPNPSFYDEDDHEKYNFAEEEKLDESLKFHEMLNKSTICSLSDIQSDGVQHNNTMLDESNLRQAAKPFLLNVSFFGPKQPELSASNSDEFRLITEEEFQRKQTCENHLQEAPFLPMIDSQSVDSEIECGEMVTSDNDYSITNLEHHSYLKSLTPLTRKTINDIIKSRRPSQKVITEKEDLDQFSENGKKKTVFTKFSKNKPVVVGYKPKSHDDPVIDSKSFNWSLDVFRERYKAKRKLFPHVKRNASNNEGVRSQLQKRFTKKKIWKSLSDTSHSCSSIDRYYHEKKFKNGPPNLRVHDMYNLEASSMVDFVPSKSWSQSVTDSMISEPILPKNDRSVSERDSCSKISIQSSNKENSVTNYSDDRSSSSNQFELTSSFSSSLHDKQSGQRNMYPSIETDSSEDEGTIRNSSDDDLSVNDEKQNSECMTRKTEDNSAVNDTFGRPLCSEHSGKFTLENGENQMINDIFHEKPLSSNDEFQNIAISLSEEVFRELSLNTESEFKNSNEQNQNLFKKNTHEPGNSSSKTSGEEVILPNGNNNSDCADTTDPLVDDTIFVGEKSLTESDSSDLGIGSASCADRLFQLTAKKELVCRVDGGKTTNIFHPNYEKKSSVVQHLKQSNTCDVNAGSLKNKSKYPIMRILTYSYFQSSYSFNIFFLFFPIV